MRDEFFRTSRRRTQCECIDVVCRAADRRFEIIERGIDLCQMIGEDFNARAFKFEPSDIRCQRDSTDGVGEAMLTTRRRNVNDQVNGFRIN